MFLSGQAIGGKLGPNSCRIGTKRAKHQVNALHNRAMGRPVLANVWLCTPSLRAMLYLLSGSLQTLVSALME